MTETPFSFLGPRTPAHFVKGPHAFPIAFYIATPFYFVSLYDFYRPLPFFAPPLDELSDLFH
jgi:hypothetical protein